MKGIIYKITNKVNNKVYIGQTRYTLEFRWRQHQHKKDNTHFHNAIRKYGPENFSVEVLEECDYEDLNSKEIFYIAKYNSFAEGYNLTLGGDGNRRLLLDNKYDEIQELYLSGFSSVKIAELYDVDKASILKILKSLGVKLRNNHLNLNRQEKNEIIELYKTGYSLRELGKRYSCAPESIKTFLIKENVDLRDRYNIMHDEASQQNLINDYLDDIVSLKELLRKYKCAYNIFKKILSLHGIQLKGRKGHFKMTDAECLQAIKMFKEGSSVKTIAKRFEVDKCTIYSLFKRYHVDYLTV